MIYIWCALWEVCFLLFSLLLCVLLSCFCCPFVEQKHDIWTVPKSSYQFLFFCSAPWLVTLWHPIVLLLPPLLWLAFWRASVWNTHHGSLSRFLVTHFMHILGRLLVVLLIARRSWSSFIQGNDWFCLIDISSSMPVYSYWLLTLCADIINSNGWFCLSDILTLIESVLVRWKNTMSKTLRLAEGFSPDAIAGRLAEKTRIQEEMENIVLKLQRSDCSYILRNNTIHCGKPSHSRIKRKSLIIIQIQGALWTN